MAIQTILGKAFEFACLVSLHNHISTSQPILIQDSSSLNIAKDAYNGIGDRTRSKLDLGAGAAIRHLLILEPLLLNPIGNTPLYLSIQEDARGIEGDVRDVLAIRRQNEWEIGISCKHNHSAVKHSRLSPTIDFGHMWFGIPCSRNYFNSITPLFDELRNMRLRGMRWSDISNKEDLFYVPLLNAFINELIYLDNTNPSEIPTRLLKYLLGSNDFYKIITIEQSKVTQLLSFNMYGTLNRNAGTIKPIIKLPQLIMPAKFHDISFKPGSRNTIQIVCDQGWSVSMRIHNASSYVEPSLKFDVQLIGHPTTLYKHFEPWR